MSEITRYEMRLDQKQQFEYAKFCHFIDETDGDYFESIYFSKKRLKERLFDILNNDPKKDLAWGLDKFFNEVIQESKNTSTNISMEKLGALRLKLSEAAANNFKTKEFIFPAPTATDRLGEIKAKEINDDEITRDNNPLHLETGLSDVVNKETKTAAQPTDVAINEKTEYLPLKVDAFIGKIPEQYFGDQESSRDALTAFLKNRLIQLRNSEKPNKLNREVAQRIVNDITCPNPHVLIDIFKIWLDDDMSDDEPIIRFTPDNKPIRKLNLDQFQLVTFANFCKFVDQMELDEKFVNRSQLKDIFYDVLRINPNLPAEDLIEKVSLLLYRTFHSNLEKYSQVVGEQEFSYLNHLYLSLRNAAEKNFTITGDAFLAPAEQETAGPIDKLDKYQASRRQLKIADEIWKKGKKDDDDLPN